MANRADITVAGGKVVKRFRRPYQPAALAQHEASFYLTVPWACPKLLDWQADTLVIERLPLAVDLGDAKPARALADLLERLAAEQIHHRDVMVNNVVIHPDRGPLLIDWELAIRWPSTTSYDLHGPKPSGVPIPAGHERQGPRWWRSPRARSLASHGWEPPE